LVIYSIAFYDGNISEHFHNYILYFLSRNKASYSLIIIDYSFMLHTIWSIYLENKLN
jgi:hypothetical protein